MLPRSGPVKIFGTVFGLPTDTPVPADYDGDGKADIAIYRQSSLMNPAWSSWIVSLSSGGILNNDVFNGVIWGLPGDIPVPGDYTGPGGLPDGKTDLAVYRPSNNRWYVSALMEPSATSPASPGACPATFPPPPTTTATARPTSPSTGPAPASSSSVSATATPSSAPRPDPTTCPSRAPWCPHDGRRR